MVALFTESEISKAVNDGAEAGKTESTVSGKRKGIGTYRTNLNVRTVIF